MNTILKYPFFSRKIGNIDKMQSFLAQLEFSYQVCQWDSNGVPFRKHVYVPEIHPQTQQSFHEREDKPHVLKVCNHDLYALCINEVLQDCLLLQ